MTSFPLFDFRSPPTESSESGVIHINTGAIKKNTRLESPTKAFNLMLF